MQDGRPRNHRSKKWPVIVALALLLHLAVLISVKPEFFSLFERSSALTSGADGSPATLPGAIYTISIVIDDSTDEPVIREPPEEPQPLPSEAEGLKPEPETAHEGETRQEMVDVDGLIGEGPQALPGDQTPQSVALPPRPVEITWPDTRRLKHCLGHIIDVNIEVSHTGKVLRVRVETSAEVHPASCVKAAIDSARRIVFQPGEIGGTPTTMWTQIRIEFSKKG